MLNVTEISAKSIFPTLFSRAVAVSRSPAAAPEVRGRRVTADKEGEKTTDEVSEENKAEEAPEVAVPEPEVPSSTR